MRRLAFIVGLFLGSLSGSADCQWTILASPTAASLRGIHALGNGVAWASGSSGTVLRTIDDGAHWQLCATPPNAEKLDFRGVQAFDANTAIVMSSGKGDLSRLYKTTDSCKSWKLLFTNPDKEGFWDALQFADPSTGWILGDPVDGQFQLWQSKGDEQWRRENGSIGLKADPKLQGAFAASNSSLDIGGRFRGSFPMFGSGGRAGAYVYRVKSMSVDCAKGDSMWQCANNGKEPINLWQRDSAQMIGGSAAAGIFSLVMRNEPFGVAVGGDYLKPNTRTGTAAFSTKSGKTWIAATTPPNGYRGAVAYDNTHETWITVGPNGTDISTDNGKNWHALKPSPSDAPNADQNWNALSLPFVVGPKGRIGKLRPDALDGVAPVKSALR
jgi:photosystem II stability/assembly factor-like uncharacterized protein